MDEAVCFGVDVGGTFTDAVVTVDGKAHRAKSLTTPCDLGAGVLAAIELVCGKAGHHTGSLLARASRFGLGTTAVTNTIATRKGRRTGLITNAGFEDAVPMARCRVETSGGLLHTPWAIVPRRAIRGVAGRIGRDGEIITPLDDAGIVAAAEELITREKIEVLVVSFVWAFKNPEHEERAVALLTTTFPGLVIYSAVDLLPQMREYERTTYALLNAYTSGALAGIDQLAATLEEKGLSVPLLLVHSGGGSISVSEVKRNPVSLVMSGPAGGIAAAASVGMQSEMPDAIGCDMGGTTFDVSLITAGEPLRRTRGEVMGTWTAMSLVDVDSIGAGGGSVGWVNALGLLQVGPRSAGSTPGPACFSRGGTEPTVTDALFVLGYIDGSRFLGGDMALDREAAIAACGRLGVATGRDPEMLAWGIREIALADMAKATRRRLAERGLDAGGYGIVSFGGCASLFAAPIAQAIGVRRIVVPLLASVLSAFGAATADVRRERVRSVNFPLPCDPLQLRERIATLREETETDLQRDGVPLSARSIRFEADLRLRRQQWELTLPIDENAPLDGLAERFCVEYEKRYGVGSLNANSPLEIALVRAIGVGITPKAHLQGENIAAGASSLQTPQTAGTRKILLDDGAGPLDVRVYLRENLVPGHAIAGPTVIDASDTTIWVPEGCKASVDAHHAIIIEVGQ